MCFSGIVEIDQVLNVLLTTAMFVGGSVAFILDNTIPGNVFSMAPKPFEMNLEELWSNPASSRPPGSPEERGIRKLKRGAGLSAAELEGMRSYDLPFGMDFIRRHAVFKYFPISPTFQGYQWGRLQESCRSRMGQGDRVKGGEGGATPGESRV